MANIKIEIAENGTTTLATAGKYCDRNVDIDVSVAGGGGGDSDIPETAFIITGGCQYRFANGGWDWFIDLYGDKITTTNITACSHMFNTCSPKRIPFDINLSPYCTSLSHTFNNCYSSNMPYIKGVTAIQTGTYSNSISLSSLFTYASHVKEIPEDYFEVMAGPEVWEARKQYTSSTSNLFCGCRSLRKYPKLDNVVNKATGSSNLYYCLFQYCNCLDEVNNLPLLPNSLTSNAFSNTFAACNRLTKLTFKMNEDGTPQVASWKSQTIDLSSTIGYTTSFDARSHIANGRTGITADKQVTDDATYQALKNDPDWFSLDVNYSRYNHDSAVNTINSLPDCSATGTNTIKFKGEAGALTDGGAINTLTEEEIAVAVAKGWGVSFV